MKLLIGLIIALVSFTSVPAFACGPMGNGGTNNMSPGREKWTRNRMGQLKARRQAQKGERATNMGTDVVSRTQQMNDPFAPTVNDNLREAQKRQREIDQLEFLALKKERGELSPAGQKKLDALVRHVRNQ